MISGLHGTARRSLLQGAMCGLLVVGTCAGCGAPSGSPTEPSPQDTADDPCLVWGDVCLDGGLDDDGDGLSNQVEIDLGTDPLSPDSDADGLIDSYEVGVGDVPADADGDGIIDALESRNTDLDCDGLSDQDDATHDPIPEGVTRVDRDGDGVLETCLFDTDGDGLTDDLDCDPTNADITDTCPPGPVCTVPVCEPGVGCVDEPLGCDDDDRCTSDRCDEDTGDCEFLDVTCDSAPCRDNMCDPLTGTCVLTVKDCSDDLLCTSDEYCDGNTGECVWKDMNCDDADACTADTCNPDNGVCQYTHVTCNDGDPCTTEECDPATGACLSLAPKCDDQSPCSTDLCDPQTGECTYQQVGCDDGNECTVDLCEPDAGGCIHEAKECDDDDPCTDTTCDPVSGWCDHPPIDCHDFDACTVDTCDPPTGECLHEGVTCSDVLPCTDDGCLPSVGCVFPPKACDDGDPCTTGSCVAADGECEFTPVSCDDGDPCTTDTCSIEFGGACAFAPVACDDQNPCTADSCEAVTGDCVHTSSPPAALTFGSTEDATTCLALWNATDECLEGAGTGHGIPACEGGPSPYFLAAAHYEDIVPEAAGVGQALSATGMEDFEAHIATMGFGLTDLTLRLSLGSLGDDEEGVGWLYNADTAVETRHYQGITIELWLDDKRLVSSNLGTVTATVDHSTCAPSPRPMTLESGWAYVTALTETASPSTQLAAQLLQQALGVPAKNQLTLDVTPEDVTLLEADGRTGHIVGSVTGTLTGVTCEPP